MGRGSIHVILEAISFLHAFTNPPVWPPFPHTSTLSASRHPPSGTRISVYEHLRKSWVQRQQQGSGSSSGGGSGGAQQVGLGPKLLMGLAAGATGQLAAVPADLIKVRGRGGRSDGDQLMKA